MAYLIDTDTFSAIAKQSSPAAEARLMDLPDGSVRVSVITLGEVEFGITRRPVAQRVLQRIQRLRRMLPVLVLGEPVVEWYARTRAELEGKGTPIGPNDLWLAAHALAEGLTLVSGNEREYRRIPGLAVENWLR
jgi:tRNA(fMet)-specific endonuclease VapC